MTIEYTLEAIQNFRSQIEQWGVTAETLIAVAFLAGAMFILSLREVMTWFLRVGVLRDEVKNLRQDIADLKSLITAQSFDLTEPTEPVEESKKKDDEKLAKTFRLDH